MLLLTLSLINTIRISIVLEIILSILFVQSCKENTSKKINSSTYNEEIGDSFSITMLWDVYSRYRSRLHEIDTANKIDFSHINLQSDLKLHGKVRTYSEKEYSTFERSGKLKKTGFVKSQAYFYFNNDGYKLEENCDDPDFRISQQRITYKYDNKGNLIEETWYEYGKLSRIYKYRYNEKKLKIERTFLNSKGIKDFISELPGISTLAPDSILIVPPEEAFIATFLTSSFRI